MADNTDEEHLDNPTNFQPENPSGEIIPTKDTETVNPNQETENMEVHHHPDLHHKPKKWKEYFLEFLMIFLAVTLGFFAESFREHIINREKENKYMMGLVRDLKKDTLNVKYFINTSNYLLSEIEAALGIPTERLQDINTQDSFYFHFIVFFDNETGLIHTDNTLTQMQNASGFNVIEKDGVADSIISVVNKFKHFSINWEFYHDDFLKVRYLASQIIKVPFITSDKYGNSKYPGLFNHTEVFIQYDKHLLDQLYNLIQLERTQLNYLNKISLDYKMKATLLIQFLQIKYHIENE